MSSPLDVEVGCRSSNLTVFNQCCRVLNITVRTPEWLAVPVYGYIAPLIVAITIVTNTLVVLVLRRLPTPTNHVLLAMAVTELLTGLSSTPWLLYYYSWPWQGYLSDHERGLSESWCRFHDYFATHLPTIFHTAAIWLTVYLAIQRYIYVCVPGLVPRYCTLRRTRWFIVVICLMALISESPKMLAESSISLLPNETILLEKGLRPDHHVCVRSYVALIGKTIGLNTFISILLWYRAVCVHFLPCLLLLIFSGQLMKTINRADRKRFTNMVSSQPVLTTHQRSTVLHSRLMHATTRMLIVVIGIFLTIEIPVALIFIGHFVGVSYQITPHWLYKPINIMLILRNLMIILTYPVNFAIYCSMSEQFRQQFRQLFSRQQLYVPAPTTTNGGVPRFSVQLIEIHKLRRRNGSGHCGGAEQRSVTGCSSARVSPNRLSRSIVDGDDVRAPLPARPLPRETLAEMNAAAASWNLNLEPLLISTSADSQL